MAVLLPGSASKAYLDGYSTRSPIIFAASSPSIASLSVEPSKLNALATFSTYYDLYYSYVWNRCFTCASQHGIERVSCYTVVCF